MFANRWLLLLSFIALPVSAWMGDDYPPGGFSGTGHWYIAGAWEAGQTDQNVTSSGSFSYNSPALIIGGIGPQAAAFEISWLRMRDSSGDWLTSGFDGDLRLPWRPERRVRPYLILGVGYHRFYGSDTQYFDDQGADNGARTYKIGVSLTANLTSAIEADLAFLHRYLHWNQADSNESDGVIRDSDADATQNALRFTLRHLF